MKMLVFLFSMAYDIFTKILLREVLLVTLRNAVKWALTRR